MEHSNKLNISIVEFIHSFVREINGKQLEFNSTNARAGEEEERGKEDDDSEEQYNSRSRNNKSYALQQLQIELN